MADILAQSITVLLFGGLVWIAIRWANRPVKPGKPGHTGTGSGMDRTHMAQTAAFDAEVRSDSPPAGAGSLGGEASSASSGGSGGGGD